MLKTLRDLIGVDDRPLDVRLSPEPQPIAGPVRVLSAGRAIELVLGKKRLRLYPDLAVGPSSDIKSKDWILVDPERFVTGIAGFTRIENGQTLLVGRGNEILDKCFELPKSVKRRAAVLMQACINTSMLAICRSLNGFPRERATVSREMRRKRGGYTAGPYFFSKLLVETPVDMIAPVVFGAVVGPMVGLRREGRGWFLATLALQTAASSTLGTSVGALSPSAEMALAIGPCVMVLCIMLGDETGAFAEVPDGLAPLANASLIKWGFRGCLCSEFEGLKFDPLGDDGAKKDAAKTAKAVIVARAKKKMDGPCPRTGEDVLEDMGLPLRGGAARAAKAQCVVALANAALTYLVLRFRGA